MVNQVAYIINITGVEIMSVAKGCMIDILIYFIISYIILVNEVAYIINITGVEIEFYSCVIRERFHDRHFDVFHYFPYNIGESGYLHH